MESGTAQILFEVAGRLPSGCSIVTARQGAASTGVLVSWIQQASMDPLLLSIALRHGRPLAGLVDESQRLVLNLIGEDRFVEFARHFGRGFDLAENCFAGLAIRQGDCGVILEDALGYLECTVHDRLETGDHHLYIARPQAGALLSGGEPYVHLRRTASKY